MTARLGFFAPATQTYKGLILSDSPLIYYRGGYTTPGLQQIPDETGNGLYGSYFSKSTSLENIVPGAADGRCWSTDDGGSRIDLLPDPRITGLSRNVSLEYWVIFNSTTVDGSILIQLSSAGGLSSYVANGIADLYYGASNVSNDGVFAADFVLGDLYHVVLTISAAGGATYFVNGSPVYSNATAVNYATGADGALCENRSTGANGLRGKIQEPAVYAYALSEAQVASHYAKGIG